MVSEVFGGISGSPKEFQGGTWRSQETFTGSQKVSGDHRSVSWRLKRTQVVSWGFSGSPRVPEDPWGALYYLNALEMFVVSSKYLSTASNS